MLSLDEYLVIFIVCLVMLFGAGYILSTPEAFQFAANVVFYLCAFIDVVVMIISAIDGVEAVFKKDSSSDRINDGPGLVIFYLLFSPFLLCSAHASRKFALLFFHLDTHDAGWFTICVFVSTIASIFVHGLAIVTLAAIYALLRQTFLFLYHTFFVGNASEPR